MDERTSFLSRSQTAKELEIQLQQLRKCGLVQQGKKSQKLTGRTPSRIQLELPVVQPFSAHRPAQGVACVSAKTAKVRTKESNLAASKCNSLFIRGSNFEGTTKPLSLYSPNSTSVARKQGGNYLESLEKCTWPVCSGPSFRPWSRDKREKRSRVKKGECILQEVNVERFYSKHQRSRTDCFNLSEILSQVSEISKFNEDHAERKLVPVTASHEILMAGAVRTKGLTGKDCLPNESGKTLTVPKRVTPVRKEQRLKKLLRGQLISCYDLGPVMEPFDVIVGDTLSRRNPHSRETLKLNFPLIKQEVFPFAVPHLRLPLLPSSRKELVRISNVLTKCELFPWQLQNIKIKYKKKRDLERIINAQETIPGDDKGVGSTAQKYEKPILQIFVPQSS